MHQDFGAWSRFLVNRDSTFLALAGHLEDTQKGHLSTCCNPLAKPKLIIDSGRHVEYAADITLCALGIKLRDDAQDEGWSRRLLSQVGAKTLEPAIGKAIARLNSHNFPTAEVADTILSKNEIESSRPDALGAAQATATAYGRIFEQSPTLQKEKWRDIGFSLGRLIYWDDAWRDWKKDQKRNRFNPLSQTPIPELRELMAHEFAHFQQNLTTLASTPVNETLLQVATQTQSQLPTLNETPSQAEKKRRRRERKERKDNKWYDCCDCCNFHACDCCLDCSICDC